MKPNLTKVMNPINITRRLYNATIRNHLPKKHRVLAGVAVQDTPLLDQTADKPGYKYGLVKAIADAVEDGDDVELVGFGRGVTTIHALDAGAESVTAHEAATEMIGLGRETLVVNRPFDAHQRVSIQQSLVGEPVEVYGSAIEAESVAPDTLTTADVLILDCEGSEQSILNSLGTHPDRIICETHPERGVPTEDVCEELKFRYEVETRNYRPDDTLGKRVLIAKKKDVYNQTTEKNSDHQ